MRKIYKISDGNGGHVWDFVKIKETVIAGLLLAVLISVSTTVMNRLFNVKHLEESIAQIKAYQLRELSAMLRRLILQQDQH